MQPETTAKGFEHWLKNHINILSDWSKYANNDGIKVDKIVRYENLQEELILLQNQNKIPNITQDLNQINLYGDFRKNKDYRDMYNKVTKFLVEIYFDKEIDYLQYRF